MVTVWIKHSWKIDGITSKENNCSVWGSLAAELVAVDGKI